MLRGKYLDHLGQSVTLLTLDLKQMNRGRWEICYQLSFHSQRKALSLRAQLRLPLLSLAGTDFVGSFPNANTTLVGAFTAAG